MKHFELNEIYQNIVEAVKADEMFSRSCLKKANITRNQDSFNYLWPDMSCRLRRFLEKLNHVKNEAENALPKNCNNNHPDWNERDNKTKVSMTTEKRVRVREENLNGI